jgi:hypothetical protein
MAVRTVGGRRPGLVGLGRSGGFLELRQARLEVDVAVSVADGGQLPPSPDRPMGSSYGTSVDAGTASDRPAALSLAVFCLNTD